MLRKSFSLFLVLQTFLFVSGQKEDSLFMRKIFDEALSNGRCYEDLRSLCKDVGARLAGSAESEMAVYWGEQKLKSYQFDSVYLQPIMVPHWVRGNKEVAWIKNEDGSLRKIPVTALGGSVGTNGQHLGRFKKGSKKCSFRQNRFYQPTHERKGNHHLSGLRRMLRQ